MANLEFDPVDLHMSSDHMDMHHADLQGAHRAANGDIEGAQTGWVGASASALQSKIAEWQEATDKLCGDIAAHRDAYRTAAHHYALNDTHAAEALDKTL